MILKTFPDKVKPSSKIYNYIDKNVIDESGVYWNHKTYSPQSMAKACKWNKGCYDVSKTNVAHHWEKATGYDFLVYPEIYKGVAVEKSELQYKHDGRIVQCPTSPIEGKSYQLFIDTEGSTFSEYRVFYHWGVDFIIEKVKPKTDRWGWKGLETKFHTPQLFNMEELTQINTFCTSFGLDFGELDILRAADGKLYCIDINNISGNGSKVLDKYPEAKRKYIKAVGRLCNT